VRRFWVAVSMALWTIAVFFAANRGYASWSGRLRDKEGWDVVTFDRTEVLGDERNTVGPRSALYVIVEFGDYQCPFCRSAEREKARFLDSTRGMVRIVFRQLPLVSIHNRAMKAAIASEAASEQGKFVPMHRLLMSSDLDTVSLTKDARAASLDLERVSRSASGSARKNVINDLAAAKTLGVSGTPTFFLVTPDREVRRFDSFSHLSQFVSRELGIAPPGDVDSPSGNCGPQNNRCGP